jgi:antitoxin ParD1/3/4
MDVGAVRQRMGVWNPLTKEFESYVTEKVESGLYQSASEGIRDGLRLMRERDELHQSRVAEFRRDIAIGIDQAERGQVQPFNEEVAARVKACGRKRLAAKDRSDSV